MVPFDPVGGDPIPTCSQMSGVLSPKRPDIPEQVLTPFSSSALPRSVQAPVKVCAHRLPPCSCSTPSQGAAGESLGMERYPKTNTSKRRTYSLFRQGYMYYQAIPNMPEHRLLPLMERFAQLVRDQPIFCETFGFI